MAGEKGLAMATLCDPGPGNAPINRDRETKELGARKKMNFKMPSVHNSNKHHKSERSKYNTKNNKKDSPKENIQDITEEFITPPIQDPKQLALWDMKYLKKNKDQEAPEASEDMHG